MMSQFFDRQNPTNLTAGQPIGSAEELRSVLDNLRDRKPFFAELIGENGLQLLLGIGFPQSCVQLSATDGSVPYLMAVSPESPTEVGEVEFLIGDTVSPVPKRYAIPYKTMVEIASSFVESGKRHSGVMWEEV